MNFYKKLYYFIIILPLAAHKLKITNSGLSKISPCSVGLEFYVVLNNTSKEDVSVELIPDECCLKSDEEDCNSLQIIGECTEVLPGETTKAVTLVAPLLDPYDRIGHCTVHVDSRPIDRKRDIIRDTLNIHFDTRIKNEDIQDILTHCKKIDEDPLNNCKPVNCETYYNGKKSYFDKETKRCAEIPVCIDKKGSKSKKIYDPRHNRCVSEDTIQNDDIEFIKSLANKDRHAKDILIIKSVNKPIAVNSNIGTDKSVVYYKAGIKNNTNMKILNVKTRFFCTKYLFKNKYTLLVLTLVITAQCCLIITMIYCLSSSSNCCQRKKVVRKFFNYRQDASVTTPLIGTSNMDTETTEFEYVSESSNVDQKIKCYKACQKEQNPKSMSDDILSKCLNRRNWNTKPKSEIIQETVNNNVEVANTKYEDDGSKFENAESKFENAESRFENAESARNKNNKKKESKNNVVSNITISEKEIKCLDYNLKESKVDFGAIDHSNAALQKKASVATEKGAQACFSKDSIDEFLSERGMIFLAEDTSKFSLTSISSPNNSSRTQSSSKTSKNNFIKNVLSYLSKSKITSSDPGVKKSESKNLELLHLSRASVYSSSTDRKIRDSRSSF